MKNKLYILAVIGLMAIGCSRKSAPTIKIPTLKNPCDSTIQALIDSISNETHIAFIETNTTDTICITDSSNCDYYKLSALQIAGKYNSAIKERDFYKLLAEKNAKKIINNNYTNSNNKNSQIGDNNNNQKSKSAPNQNGKDNVFQETKKGVNQNGEGNDGTFKPKDSQVGDGNTQTNNYDFWKGFFTCFALFVAYFALRRTAKSYFPFLKFLP